MSAIKSVVSSLVTSLVTNVSSSIMESDDVFIPFNALFLENGQPLKTEDGKYVTKES